MRIVLDLQGAQTESRFRGIGRYTMSLAKAIVRNRGEHEIILALSGLFPDTIEPIRAEFDGLLPQENIRVWHAPGPVKECQPGNEWRREVAERIREAFLASLRPDIIHVFSLFEGYVDDAVTSIGKFDNITPVAVIIYDLIPFVEQKIYLDTNHLYRENYIRKIEYLKNANFYFAISNHTANEAIQILNLDKNRVVNISAAVEPYFKTIEISTDEKESLFRKYGIKNDFIMYSGATDFRKNIDGLIKAYAKLPAQIRNEHQLVLVGKISDGTIREFKEIAKKTGLADSELVITGYVPDEDLIKLYNLCKLLVFPSFSEGFGFPPLEAMSCGAAVISSNRTSLPEVIGREDVLFDPSNVEEIADKMKKILTNDTLRKEIREYGLNRAKEFSWDKSAQKVIQACENLNDRAATNDYLTYSVSYDKLLTALVDDIKMYDESYILALSQCIAKNESAGIQRQLLVDVSELCQHDAGTGVQRVVRSYLRWLLQMPPAGFRVEPVYATLEQGYRYARRFTLRFLGKEDLQVYDAPIRWQRGDIFFGLDMQHHVQLTHAGFYQQLRQEGVVVKFLVHDLLPIQFPDLFKDSNARALHEQWLAMIAASDGAICVSRATAEAFEAWLQENGILPDPTFCISWVHSGADIEGSKASGGMPHEALNVLNAIRQRPAFLCVSTLEPRKRQQQILEAIECLWNEGVDVNLVLVGKQGWKIEPLVARLQAHPELNHRLFWLEGISDEFLEHAYEASTCLIAASLNEGFGLPLIEAARHQLPIIARDIPVFREVAGEYAFYFQGESAEALADALKTWLENYRSGQYPKSKDIQWNTWQQSTEKLKTVLIEHNNYHRQIFLDISELVQRDAKTGIQRVVRSILKECLHNPPEGYRVEPVYATVEQGYRYARQYTKNFLGLSNIESLDDEPIDYAPGDIFFVLDLQPQVQVANRAFLQELRRYGVRVIFMVHDLLCVRMPQHFLPGAYDNMVAWLQVVAESDAAVCVSEATAMDLMRWTQENSVFRQRPFKIAWSHNGADIDNSQPTGGLPNDANAILNLISSSPSFLMVSTIEPRKCHAQVIAAFEQLWQSSMQVNLVILGKQGWMVEELVAKLRLHPELGKRLFWLGGISDEYLEKVYAASTCLIMASEGEGFGLPLIEAARHKLPIIARDIPVFREIAGEYAFYFPDDKSPQVLAEYIEKWLNLYKEEKHPKSEGMPYLTWKESAQNLINIIMSL